ncbi:MAG: hypothetical protein FWG26_07890 [Betaproteobacteria bacterium]|nr:hypothetical protein [Betaproteobacteria bacterium]
MKAGLLIFFLGLFCGDLLASPDVEPREIVRNAIVEQFLNGEDIRLKQETPVDVAFIKEIAQKRLGYDIVASATEVAGVDFHFESSKHEKAQYLSHVGVWVFSYRNNEVALCNANAIKGFCKGNCFRTKLLTYFSKTVIANKIIIVFTENSGDESIVGFIKSAPKLFDR